FSAEDDASGYNSTEFYVDTDPESCDYEGPLVSTMPAGSCQNDLYTAPFTLAPGTHTLYYHSYDNVDNGGEMQQFALSVDTGGWIRGSVATPDLPPGSTVTLLVSGDMFRDDPLLFPFAAQGTSLSYALQLPAPATYYIGAAAWFTEEEEFDIPSGTPIGIYNDYAPVHLAAPAAEAAGVDITASPDTEAPEVSITSPVYNGGLDSIDQIAGFLSDDTGAPELEFALRDVASGLWYMNGGWQTSEEPPFATADILFDGPPSSCSWRAADSGEGMLGGIAGTLVQGAVYELFVLAEDFTTNEPDPTPSVRFTWTAGQGPSAPGAVEGLAASDIGLSSIAWTWQAAAAADGYAVYSPEQVFLSSETGTAWTLTGLAAAAPAGLCVSAYNAAGEGPRACASPRYTLPAVPGAPSAVQVSSYSLMFRWYTGVNSPGADCELELSTDDFAGAEPLSFRLAAWNEETDLAVDGLSAGATYYARTRAFNGENVPSAYSASTAAVTEPAPLTPPDNTPPYTELSFSGP
ncbi:MAG TPA: hypothetical protein PK523_12170, partial [Elusimicrobiales bacterium]|nr:hypothetical protein [Elusimicrobiales bacterium]